jgi:hypothetical protein
MINKRAIRSKPITMEVIRRILLARDWAAFLLFSTTLTTEFT